MTDIWRSFIAQRIAWENNWHVLFHAPTVWQERNAHNLMRDFADEIPGYLHNRSIGDALERLDLAASKDKPLLHHRAQAPPLRLTMLPSA